MADKQRVDDYRSGYSAGWADGKNGEPMQDAAKAELFFGHHQNHVHRRDRFEKSSACWYCDCGAWMPPPPTCPKCGANILRHNIGCENCIEDASPR